MNAMVHVQSLDVGDQLGIGEPIECCSGVMDYTPGGLECGGCAASLSHDHNGIITDIEHGEDEDA